MGIPTSGTIKMMGAGTNSIAQEKAGTTSGLPTAVTNVSLKGLSVDGVRDFVSGGSTNVDIAVAGSTPDQQAPHAMSEFYGYVHTNLSDFPSLSSWSTQNSRTVSGGNTTGQAQAFCSISFQNDTAQKRLIITYYGGTNAAFATINTAYMSYSGYTGNINVQYNGSTPLVAVNSNSSSYPPYGWPGNTSNSSSHPSSSSSSIKAMATNFTIPTSGTIQFKWFISTNTSGSNQGNQSDYEAITHSGVTFNINFTSNSTAYSKTSGSSNIALTATKGGTIQ